MMSEIRRYEDIPETTPESAGMPLDIEPEVETETQEEVENLGDKPEESVDNEPEESVDNEPEESVDNEPEEEVGSTDVAKRESVKKDIKEKLNSIDINDVDNINDVKNIVNDLIEKYFNLDNISSEERNITENFIRTKNRHIGNIERIINNIIKGNKLTKNHINDLWKNFLRLTKLFYGDGRDDKKHDKGEGQNKNRNKERDKNRNKSKSNSPRQNDTKNENEGENGGEQNDSYIPIELTKFSGNFNKWNRKNFGNKNINDATELVKYQEQIRNKINTENTLTKQTAYRKYDNKIKYDEFSLEDAITYATAIGLDIKNYGEFKCFIGAIVGIVPDIAEDDPNYMRKYNEFKIAYGIYYYKVNVVENHIIKKIYVESLTPKRDVINNIAKARSSHEGKSIKFSISSVVDNKSHEQDQSGLKIANDIGDIGDKLNHYKFNSNRSHHEESALKYAAFDIAFKNTFNPNNPMIKKLSTQKVDLRADLFSYGIYDQDSNSFNKAARDRYVTKKLQPIGLAPEEVEELGRAVSGLPNEVQNNYEVLGGNFDADQENFERIAKIYALGEIIDSIKNLFANGEVLNNPELGNSTGFKFDESSADIIGDYLILKGEVNGTKTNVKYDLRTGKLYMNSFTYEEFNPPKITVGNDEPNTEIGDIGNFDDLLDGYQPTSFTKAPDLDYSKSYNMPYDNKNIKIGDEETRNLKALEILLKNKLGGKLTKIGEIVQEKAGEQSKENNVIDDFLKTFNILPDGGNSDTIEFMGGSNLFVILESIKNTNDEGYLLKFSNLMSELMSFCGMTRGKNNLFSNENEFDSVTIFDIDEKNATQDIISLQRANKNFFSGTGSEKDKIKGYELHFDSSVQLSFANIIVQKCCRRYGDGWKISANLAEEFVNSVKEGIKNIKKDENDLITVENIIDDDSMWA